MTGTIPGGAAEIPARRLAEGVEDVLATADLRGKPTVIVHGRADALIAVNHSSRSYYGSALRQKQNIRYYEVTNAHHLDAFNAIPAFAAAYVPLHVYFNEGLDYLYDHLTKGDALPPSQVVHTVPRGPVFLRHLRSPGTMCRRSRRSPKGRSHHLPGVGAADTGLRFADTPRE